MKRLLSCTIVGFTLIGVCVACGGSSNDYIANEEIRKIGNDVCYPHQLSAINQTYGRWHIFCATEDGGYREINP